MEQWKDVVGYEGRYKISNYGNVYSYYSKRIMSPNHDGKGYLTIQLAIGKYDRKRFKVHRLVAMHFINNLNNYPVVNHIDGNKHNNNVSNLEWCTHSYNNKHAIDNGLTPTPTGEHNPAAKLNDNDVITIKRLLLSNKYKQKDIAKMYNVDACTINDIKAERSWSHINV